MEWSAARMGPAIKLGRPGRQHTSYLKRGCSVAELDFFFSVITFTGGKDPWWEVHRKPLAVAIGRGIEFPYFVTCIQCAVQVILFVSYLLFVSACTQYVGMGIGR